MKPEVQAEIKRLWATVETPTVNEHADVAGYRSDFLRLFGFGISGVDYAADVPDNLI
jgi:enoyl-[acyl-carrier protein] reductase/trans-2-enoyl-CoA reductase (NAD+)